MVDYLPWLGNYTNTVVHNNTILGGFATTTDTDHDNKGTNSDDAVIKIGIAIGPRTWFGDRYLNNVSFSGTVLNNRLSGAFSYGIAMSSATNFTVEDNVLFGNYSFIGASGPNCSTSDVVPTPAPFVYDNSTTGITLQTSFQLIPDADSLTCVLPPENGDYWPYGGDPGSSSTSKSADQSSSDSSSSSSVGGSAGVVVGVIAGVAAFGVLTWFVRKWVLKRIEKKNLYNSSKEFAPGKGAGYTKQG